MRGSDIFVVVIGTIYHRARGLTIRKSLIALGLCTLVVVLPVGFARSHNEMTTPITRADGSLTQAAGSPDAGGNLVLYTPANPPARQATGNTPAADAPVQSLSTYPNPLQPRTASSPADARRQLVEEIQRRLAIMKSGGSSAVEPQQPKPILQQVPPQQTQILPETPTPAPNRPVGLDADAQLQLFDTVKRIVPDDNALPPIKQPEPTIDLPSVATPIQNPVETQVTQKLPEPNLVPNPQAQAAFEQHFKTARLYHQQGQYARAAEAYTLALAYRPNDANVYLCKGYALLAAGQYRSSGAALAKAVELDPKRSLRKVDVVTMTGGPDQFIARFNEMAEGVQTHPTPEQHFLLAYVYYQMDQFEQAKNTLETAPTGSLSPAAMENLRSAIDR